MDALAREYRAGTVFGINGLVDRAGGALLIGAIGPRLFRPRCRINGGVVCDVTQGNGRGIVWGDDGILCVGDPGNEQC